MEYYRKILDIMEADMKWQQMIIEAYQNMFQEIEKVLDSLTVEDLKQRPSPGANPIGWLIWHCLRSCDRQLGDVILGQQLWISAGWHKKFNRPPDYSDTGNGHTDAQVDALEIPDIKTLLDYENAIQKPYFKYLESLTEKELDKEYPSSQYPGTTRPVHLRLMGQLAHNYPHLGQAAYVRGLIKGHRWSGR
jgi:hypothetical protein